MVAADLINVNYASFSPPTDNRFMDGKTKIVKQMQMRD